MVNIKQLHTQDLSQTAAAEQKDPYPIVVL